MASVENPTPGEATFDHVAGHGSLSCPVDSYVAFGARETAFPLTLDILTTHLLVLWGVITSAF